MPTPVRSVWEAASEEQQRTAHQRCAMIIETWVGRMGRPEAADVLGITPLRLWQLSQRALAGMLAGLVTQPRHRGRVVMVDPQNDARALKKRVAQLEKELSVATDLITILREMPTHRAAEEAARQPARRTAGKARKAPRKQLSKRDSTSGGKKAGREPASPAGDAPEPGPLAG